MTKIMKFSKHQQIAIIFTIMPIIRNKKNTCLALIAGFAFILASCSTDLDINAEWEDIPVVYCVLDQSMPYQYVKVNKTFLGEQPASVMAQYSDSLYYDKVEVLLHEFTGPDHNPSKIRTVQFDEVDTIPKDPGFFASERNLVYISDINLDETYKYQLEVIIDDGRKHVLSEITELISGAFISVPGPALQILFLSNYNASPDYKYYTGTSSKVFQMKLCFNYIEVSENDTTYHTIEWPQAIDIRNNTSENIEVAKKYDITAFYQLLINNIDPPSENIKRYVKMPDSFEFNLAMANEDYRTYMELSAPSHGIIQEKPSYTNLSDGYGLFAAKYNTQKVLKLGISTLDSIHRGIYTNHLGFESPFSQYYQSNF